MAEKLSLFNSLLKVREQAGAIGDDGTPDPASGFGSTDQFDSRACRSTLAYWTATGETGTVTLQLWALSNEPTPKFVLVSQATLVPPNKVVELLSYGSSRCVLAFADTAAAVGSTAAQIYAANWNEF